MRQDRRLEVPQRSARIETELLTQQRAGVGEHAQRVGLAISPVQGEGQPGGQALAQGMVRRELLQLADEMAVTAEREVGVDALLQDGQPALLECRRLGEVDALVHELDERRTAPQRQRVGQRLPGRRRRSRLELAVALGGELLEPVDVDGVAGQVEAVAGVVVEQRRPTVECSAQAGDVALQRPGRRPRRTVAPDRLDERAGADRAAVRRDERGQQHARAGVRPRRPAPRPRW